MHTSLHRPEIRLNVIGVIARRLLLASGLVTVCLLLSACASVAPAVVDQHFLPWQAATREQLIAAFGPPGQRYEENGVLTLEWTRTDIDRKPSISIGVGGYGRHVSGGVSTTVYGGQQLLSCTLRIRFNSGSDRVTQLQWFGDTDTCIEAFPVFR